jgi:hypothetical protein
MDKTTIKDKPTATEKNYLQTQMNERDSLKIIHKII